MITTLILTALATILRGIALLFSFENGYFISSPLTVLQAIFMIATFLFLLLAPLFVERESPSPQKSASTSVLVATGCMTLLFLLNFINACTIPAKLTVPGFLMALAFLSFLVAIVYFAIRFFKQTLSDTLYTLLGFGVILALAALICLTYFDTNTSMNAPQKVNTHLALLSLMFFMLYELRRAAGIGRPRVHMASAATAFFLSFNTAVTNILGFLAKKHTNSLFFVTDLLLLGFAVYIGAIMASTAFSVTQDKT